MGMIEVSAVIRLLSGYLAPNGAASTMLGALNQVVPRLLSKGDWPGALREYSVTVGSSRTVSLPEDEMSVLYGEVNDSPRSVKEIWFDRREQRGEAAGYLLGLVDMGIHPTSVALNPDYFFRLVFAPLRSGEEFTGYEYFRVEGESWDGEWIREELTPGAGDVTISPSNAALKRIHSISFEAIDINVKVSVQVMEVASMSGYTDAGTLDTIDQSRGFTETLQGAGTMVLYDVTNDPVDANYDGLTFTIDSLTDSQISFSSSNPSQLVDGDTVATLASNLETSSFTVGMIRPRAGVEVSGTLNYRVFKVAEASSTSSPTVNMLLKRKHVELLSNDDVIPISNIPALKHAILGLNAEDRSDSDRSKFHWDTALELLDDELTDYMKSARPVPEIKPFSEAGFSIPIIR